MLGEVGTTLRWRPRLRGLDSMSADSRRLFE